MKESGFQDIRESQILIMFNSALQNSHQERHRQREREREAGWKVTDPEESMEPNLY